jgi:cysteine desulfurase
MKKIGYDVTYLKPDRKGRILLEAVEGVLRPGTALLCVQAVNNETGIHSNRPKGSSGVLVR